MPLKLSLPHNNYGGKWGEGRREDGREQKKGGMEGTTWERREGSDGNRGAGVEGKGEGGQEGPLALTGPHVNLTNFDTTINYSFPLCSLFLLLAWRQLDISEVNCEKLYTHWDCWVTLCTRLYIYFPLHILTHCM